MPSSVKKSSNFNELAGKPYAKRNHYDESRYSQDFGVIVISFESNCGHGVDTLMNLQRCDVVLLNDDQTPMEFVVINQRDNRSRPLICPVRPAGQKGYQGSARE